MNRSTFGDDLAHISPLVVTPQGHQAEGEGAEELRTDAGFQDPTLPVFDLATFLSPLELSRTAASAQPAEAQDSTEHQASASEETEALYDFEGRKLGPRGILNHRRNQLIRAYESNDQALILESRQAVIKAEQVWKDWCVRSGYRLR